jgi:DNA topoisomerase I
MQTVKKTRQRKTGEGADNATEIAAAQEAGLRYVTDSQPGIAREPIPGDGTPVQFRYRDAAGKLVRDKAVLARIRGLVIPPAWTQVWICALEDGHLQATGRDARGRKQYRYHAHWRVTRDANKYARLKDFVRALPRIRKVVHKDLRMQGLPKQKVLAAVVRLLETTLIRVGNEKYARDNGSFGLTTMRNRHIKVRGQRMQFDFRGKSGKQHSIELTDARLAAIVRRCRELPGQELFQYLDADGAPQSLTSTDVNDYLSALSGGQSYTAKDFRTWAGTVLAALAMRRFDAPTSETQRKRNINQAIRLVAQKLGNTPAICRKCYVHPDVLEVDRERLVGLPRFDVAEFSTTRISRRHELKVLNVLYGNKRAGARRHARRPAPQVPAARPRALSARAAARHEPLRLAA